MGDTFAMSTATTPSRGERGRQERHRRVIEAAMSLASEGGYEAVTMRSVAERAQVATGTIYRYFSGKDEILTAGLAGWLAQTRRLVETQRVEQAEAHSSTPCDRLHLLLDRMADSTDRHRMLIGALVRAVNSPDPAMQTHKLEVERQLRALVVSAIGPTDDDRKINAEGVARIIGHVWSSALSRWVGGLAPDGSVGDELRHAVDLLAAPVAPLVGHRSV